MLKMKLWSYYVRRKTNQQALVICRCVAVFHNAYVVKHPCGKGEFVPINQYSLELWDNLPSMENK